MVIEDDCDFLEMEIDAVYIRADRLHFGSEPHLPLCKHGNLRAYLTRLLGRRLLHFLQ